MLHRITKYTKYCLLICIPLLLVQCKSIRETAAPAAQEEVEDGLTTEQASLPKINTQMRTRSLKMLKEINRLRRNPQSYIPEVRDYLARVSNDTRRSYEARQAEMAAARELILELSRTRPLPELNVHEGLYLLAQKQALDMNVSGAFTHMGLDGTTPWERISRYTNLSSGNENFIAGADQMEAALMALLVDGSVPGRGHRMNLLNPKWTYGAIYYAEQLNGVPSGWIQLFGCCPETDVPAVRPETKADLYAALDPEATQKTIPGFVTVQPVNPNDTEKQDGRATPYEQVESTSKKEEPTTKPATRPATKPSTSAPSTSNPKATDDALPAAASKPSPITASQAPYMSAEERLMMDEVNLVRSNPKAYVPYINQYLKNYRDAGWDAEMVAEEERVGQELIVELEKLKPLPLLSPNPNLYRVAQAHGMDMKSMGRVDHTGSDGSSPFGRIQKQTQLKSGNENLVGGALDVRESVIMLLIDSGIPGRGHRRTLLKSDWDVGAMYQVGKVGEMPNVWVQMFGER